MRRKTKELDVDFIGEQNQPLTKEEQLSISAFFQKLKEEKKTKSKGNVRKSKQQPA